MFLKKTVLLQIVLGFKNQREDNNYARFKYSPTKAVVPHLNCSSEPRCVVLQAVQYYYRSNVVSCTYSCTMHAKRTGMCMYMYARVCVFVCVCKRMCELGHRCAGMRIDLSENERVK